MRHWLSRNRNHLQVSRYILRTNDPCPYQLKVSAAREPLGSSPTRSLRCSDGRSGDLNVAEKLETKLETLLGDPLSIPTLCYTQGPCNCLVLQYFRALPFGNKFQRLNRLRISISPVQNLSTYSQTTSPAPKPPLYHRGGTQEWVCHCMRVVVSLSAFIDAASGSERKLAVCAACVDILGNAPPPPQGQVRGLPWGAACSHWSGDLFNAW